jgi:hypothetical protein
LSQHGLPKRLFNWCTANPAKGIERNHEAPRHRYLSADELVRLTALGRHKAAAVTHSDVEALHRRISLDAPYAANKTVAVLSRPPPGAVDIEEAARAHYALERARE